MFNKENLIDDIVSEAFGFDNTPSTCDSERELRQELHYLMQKPRIGATARRIRDIQRQLEQFKGNYDHNTAVRPSWLGDDDIDKETRMSADTIRYWHKMNPRDEEMARKSAELDEYDNMQKMQRDRFKFDVPEVYKKKTVKDLFPDEDEEQAPISYEQFIAELDSILEDFEPSDTDFYDWDYNGLSAEDIFDSEVIITLIDVLEEKLHTNVCSYNRNTPSEGYEIDVDGAAPWFKEYYEKADSEGVFKEVIDALEDEYKTCIDMSNNPALYDTSGDDAYEWWKDSE